MKHFLKAVVFSSLISCSLLTAQVDESAPTTSTPPNKTDIDFVPVGDPINQPDTTGYGSVLFPYSIGTTDVTAAQYCAFLNAVASKSDPYQLYDERMTSDLRVASITRSGSLEVGYTYSPMTGREQFPITYVSWYSSARFCNWLQNQQPSGDEGPTTTETGVYSLEGNQLLEINSGGSFFLPTEDQWYKAAYYKGGSNHAGYWSYPTQSSWIAPGNTTGKEANQANYFCNNYATKTMPYLTPVKSFIGSYGPYKTYDMGGNVAQWTSTFEKPTSCIARGGSWKSQYRYYTNNDLQSTTRQGYDPTEGSAKIGFRVTSPLPLTSFNSWSSSSFNSIIIECVPVGDPGNPSDYTNHGAVPYKYEIAKYDVTAAQYCAFLNAVATGHMQGLYDPKMGTDTLVASITRSGTSGQYQYSVIPGRENLPITYVSWYNAAYFCNWIENGQLSGPEGEASLFSGAFSVSGGAFTINSNSRWSLPSEDEWYKAAYYSGGKNGHYWSYPTCSNTAPGNTVGSAPNQANYLLNKVYSTKQAPYLTPVGSFTGSPGPYGTFDMGGNTYEWTRSFTPTANGSMQVPVHGGAFFTADSSLECSQSQLADLTNATNGIGFRLVYRKPDVSAINTIPSGNTLANIKTSALTNPVDYAFNIFFLGYQGKWGLQWMWSQLKGVPSEMDMLRGGVVAFIQRAEGGQFVNSSTLMRMITPGEAAPIGWFSREMAAAIGRGLILPATLAAGAALSFYYLPPEYGTPLTVFLGGWAACETVLTPLYYIGEEAVPYIRTLLTRTPAPTAGTTPFAPEASAPHGGTAEFPTSHRVELEPDPRPPSPPSELHNIN